MIYIKNKKNSLLILILILSAFLRLRWLGSIPSSLYSDEADQGYNAYSLLKTGKDEHGKFLPVSLRSFGDWKPPLPTYLMIPSIMVFGLNELAVRFPSAILGLATIPLTYFLSVELFKGFRFRSKLGLISALMLGISPWHILHSRAAMLVIVGLFFFEAGVYFFIRAIRTSNLFILSSTMFALSIYSYYGLRVITPLMILFLFFYYRYQILLLSRSVILAILTGVIILLPLGLTFLSNPDVIFGRAKTVSVFYDRGVKLRQWELFTQDGSNFNTILTRFYHNAPVMYTYSIFKHFLSHFNGRYLFVNGDQSPPFGIPNMGILYFFDGVFLIFGLYILYRKKFKSRFLISTLLIISFIPASLTFMTPSSNRTFTGVLPMMMIVAVGLSSLLRKIKLGLFPIVVITFGYTLHFLYFMNQYFNILPVNYAVWWNYGLEQTAQFINSIQSEGYDFVISDVDGMPYVYLLFYQKYPPKLYHKEAIRTYHADRFGYEHVQGFGNYIFDQEFDWRYLKKNLQPHTVYVVPAGKEKDMSADYIVRFPDGKAAYNIYINE